MLVSPDRPELPAGDCVARLHDDFHKGDIIEVKAPAGRFVLETVVYSRPKAEDMQGRDYQRARHVDIELLKNTPPHGRHHVYVCGPPPVMERLIPALRAWGVAAEDLHFQTFGPASATSSIAASADARRIGATALDITFRRPGRMLQCAAGDGTLVDFAEMPSAGRMEAGHDRSLKPVCAGGCPCYRVCHLPYQQRHKPLRLLWVL